MLVVVVAELVVVVADEVVVVFALVEVVVVDAKSKSHFSNIASLALELLIFTFAKTPTFALLHRYSVMSCIKFFQIFSLSCFLPKFLLCTHACEHYNCFAIFIICSTFLPGIIHVCLTLFTSH